MKLLDLFCGAGGASVGYARAGWEVTGVDIADHPYYPYTLITASAIDVLKDTKYCEQFDFIHASPPCQSSSALTKGTNFGRLYEDFIPETRELLHKLNVPSVIENVQGSQVRRDITLCGEMFDLAVIRHRYFEFHAVAVPQPIHKKHRGRVAGMRHGVWYEGPYFAVYGEGGGKGTVPQWQKAMGIDWTPRRRDIAEAIPPAYTEYIGTELVSVVHSCDEPRWTSTSSTS